MATERTKGRGASSDAPETVEAERTLTSFSIPSAMSLRIGGEPAGVAVIARFCAAIRDGKAPDASDMELIATAALELLPDFDGINKRSRNNGLQAFARAIGLYGPQVRAKPTVANVERNVGIVVWVLRKEAALIRAGIAKRSARAEAKRLAAARFHKTESGIRYMIKELEETARAEIAAERAWRRLGGTD